MRYATGTDYWHHLESNAHLPDIQNLIRQEIQSGTIRVRPGPDGGIRIVPIEEIESGELEEFDSFLTAHENGRSRFRRVVRRCRLARR
jgi:hypothetical protein